SGKEDTRLPEGEGDAPPGVRLAAAVRWSVVVVMALVAAASLLYYSGAFSHSVVASGKTVYYCPMHPSIVQDHPGECPICSMTLVPKPAGNAKPSASMKPTVEPMAPTAAERAAGKYYCPMHPNRTSNDPKARCPDCGMKMQ